VTPEELKIALRTPDKKQRLALIKKSLSGASLAVLKTLLLETAHQRTGNGLSLVLKALAQHTSGELNETLLAIYDLTQAGEKKALLAILHQTGYLDPLLRRLPTRPAGPLLDYAEHLNRAQFLALFRLSSEALNQALDQHIKIWHRRKGKT
jgi:hypothetical protein